jgi:hypothetical protein
VSAPDTNARRAVLAALAAGVPSLALGLHSGATRAAARTAAPSDAAAGSAAGAVPGVPRESRFLTFATPEDEFRAHFRYERDLRDESHVLTWYHFTLYAVADGERPAPVVRYEGMEFSYFRRLKDLVWRIHAHNVSFPRRLDDGAFATEVASPLTGAAVRPPTMLLLDDPGVLYSPRGYLPLDAREPHWLPSQRTFRIDGDAVVVDHVRPTPDGWPKTFIEASTSWAPRAAFDDPRITSLPCGVSGFYVFPFPKWLEAGARRGHMIGAWLGHKLGGVDELPREFRERLERERPDLLRPRWGEFDRPLKFAI